VSNILNRPDYKVLQVTELEHDYQVHAEVSEPPTHCPHCNHSEIVGFGRRDEVIMDTPVHGKRTGIMLNRRRYRCQSCRKTFLEPVPHKDDKRQMTHRLIQYVEHESLRRTFSGVAEDVGVDEKTVRNIFTDYCKRLEITLKFEMPQWLRLLPVAAAQASRGLAPASIRIERAARERSFRMRSPSSGRTAPGMSICKR